MRIVVFGAGAVGGLVGGLLSVEHDVTLIGRKHAMEAIRQHGLRITGASSLLARPKVALSAREASTPELLILTVKAPDTARALRDAQPLVGPHTALLSLQNGLGNFEAARAVAGDALALAGVTTHGVTLVEPGHLHHAGVGYTRIGGASPGSRALAGQVAALLTKAGMQAEVADQIEGELWAKAIINAGINPITAITGLPNGQILAQPGLKELMERAVREAQRIAEHVGVALPSVDLVERARLVAAMTAENKSSMLQDIERGRPTEVDCINGAIVQQARALGLEAPINAALWALVKGIESTTRVG